MHGRRRAGVGAGSGGYYPGKYFDILDARMCSLERIQRRIVIVDEKKLFRLNTYGDRNNK